MRFKSAFPGALACFAGGLQIGYNRQINQFVWGVEADVSYVGADGSTTAAGPLIIGETNWAATLRGRVGYAWETMLLYGTLGVAMMDMDTGLPGLGGTA